MFISLFLWYITPPFNLSINCDDLAINMHRRVRSLTHPMSHSYSIPSTHPFPTTPRSITWSSQPENCGTFIFLTPFAQYFTCKRDSLQSKFLFTSVVKAISPIYIMLIKNKAWRLQECILWIFFAKRCECKLNKIGYLKGIILWPRRRITCCPNAWK